MKAAEFIFELVFTPSLDAADEALLQRHSLVWNVECGISENITADENRYALSAGAGARCVGFTITIVMAGW